MPKLHILNHEILTPEPYSAGHCCSPAEASVLNAALTRGLAKGAYRLLSDARERGELVTAGAIDTFVESFLKGFTEGHERLRAIETEARRIARARLEAALYRSGRKLSELAEGEQREAIQREAEKEEVLAEARRRIDALRALGSEAASRGEDLEELVSDREPHQVRA